MVAFAIIKSISLLAACYIARFEARLICDGAARATTRADGHLYTLPSTLPRTRTPATMRHTLILPHASSDLHAGHAYGFSLVDKSRLYRKLYTHGRSIITLMPVIYGSLLIPLFGRSFVDAHRPDSLPLWLHRRDAWYAHLFFFSIPQCLLKSIYLFQDTVSSRHHFYYARCAQHTLHFLEQFEASMMFDALRHYRVNSFASGADDARLLSPL